MSISTKSFESIIDLAQKYYDQHMPLYFVDEHIDMICDIILLLMQQKTIKIVRTMSMLLEPVVENNGIIYISIPLVGLLINESVELPKNNVEFVSNFDIFNGLNYGIENKELPSASCYNSLTLDDNINEFTPHERIRFTHTLRIIFICVHFIQHYEGIPYTTHKSFINLEKATQSAIIQTPSHTQQIDYSLLSN